MTNILTDAQIDEYLESLNLDQNLDIKVTLMSLTPLSLDLFREVISGLANNLISINDIMQLPSINDFTVNKLLSSKLSVDNTYLLSQKYKTVIVPKYTKINQYKIQAIGNINQYIYKLLNVDKYVIKPKYNYIISEDIGFYDFDDVLEFYNKMTNTAPISTLIEDFLAFMSDNQSKYPDIIPAKMEDCNICRLMMALQKKPYFLEINNDIYRDKNTNTLLWLFNGMHTNVLPENFDKVMQENYVLMAENNERDKSLYGETGRIILDLVLDDWQVVKNNKTSETVDKARINNYFLPLMYGEIDIANDAKANYEFMTVLLNKAQYTLKQIRNSINDRFNKFYAEQRG